MWLIDSEILIFYIIYFSIGGGIPIVFAYYCEFVTRAERGRYLSYLLVFWAIGGVFCALMAWAIIPRTGNMSDILIWSEKN